jgi:hypothetical protein
MKGIVSPPPLLLQAACQFFSFSYFYEIATLWENNATKKAVKNIYSFL